MKTKSYILILTVILNLIFCSGFTSLKKGGCENQSMLEQAVDRLKKFTMIQNFPYYLKKKKKSDPVEFKKQTITLSRGVRYKFYTVRNEDYDGLPILAIYNNEKQEFLLGTTYNPSLKKFYNELEFECKTTGNYCLSLSFQDGLEGCAIGVFASLIKDDKSS